MAVLLLLHAIYVQMHHLKCESTLPFHLRFSLPITFPHLSSSSPISLQPLKTYPLKTKVYTAAVHPSQAVFVAGGEDFLIYKVDAESGKELGERVDSWVCHVIVT